MYFPNRFVAVICTVYFLFDHAVHVTGDTDEQTTPVRTPGFQVPFRDYNVQRQVALDFGKGVAMSGFSVPKDASKFGSQFGENFSTKKGSMNFQMDSLGPMPRMRGHSVFSGAEKSFSDGSPSRYFNKNAEPGLRPRMLDGRKRNSLRRFEVNRKNDQTTTDASRDLEPAKFRSEIQDLDKGLSDATLSGNINTTVTPIEVTKEVTVTEVGDSATDIDSTRKLDDPITATEEVLGAPLSSFIEDMTGRLSLPLAADDMRMVLSGLTSSGSMDIAALPKVVAELVPRIQDAYSELSPSEVTAQVFTEICTALLHVLPQSLPTEIKVTDDTIPETAQIVSLLIQSGVDM